MISRNRSPTGQFRPIRPLKIRPPFHQLEPTDSVSPLHRHDVKMANTTIRYPEFSFLGNDFKMPQDHTFPRTHYRRNSLTDSPHVYLHTPQREMEDNDFCSFSDHYLRSLSLPTTPNPSINSDAHMYESIGRSTPTSTGASLRSVATNSLTLGSRLEKAEMRNNRRCEYI